MTEYLVNAAISGVTADDIACLIGVQTLVGKPLSCEAVLEIMKLRH